MNNFTDTVSNKLALYLTKDTNKSSEEFEVLKYGIFVFVHMCMAIVLTSIFGLVTNTFFEIMVISLIAALMKRYSGGVHCSSPNRCIATGIIVAYFFSLIAKYIISVDDNIFYILGSLMLIQSFIIIYTKCPVPSKNKPLKKEETRKRLKRKAFKIYLACMILFILNIILNKFNLSYKDMSFNSLTVCMILGLYMQNISLTSMGSRVILFMDKVLMMIKV